MSQASFNGAPVSGIIFDKDGTLFDFRATWTAWVQSFLAELTDGDPTRAHSLGQQIGFDTRSSEYHPQSPVVAGSAVEIAELLLSELPGHDFEGLLAHMNYAAARAPMAEAAPLAPTLTRLTDMGIRLGVATNDAEYPARVHLSSVGILEHFDFIAGCDSGHGAKPDPGQLLAFAAQTQCPPEQTIMVGDSRHDLRAGRAAGMITIGVLTGPAHKEDLADLSDQILDHVGDLPDFLSQ
ncbi:HAD family hydrolase [Actibacterium pelagium]|uniref:phosphoglycolate phosphatase n=1 Tax=Actibacterium pelagium TaxID=2029103 RepID=A0A917ANA2_9RHOB|nr:HAD family hydrolase [Actibacterium pelagium]GGE59758.1 phosphatase [Actibacterium pelagium]